MKRLFLSFVCLSFLFAGCVTLKTNIPFSRNDGVIITCPVSIGKIILKKYSRFSDGQEYIVLPGRETKVSADGIFADQPMTLVGFVYNKKNQIIGRVSRDFRFDGNSYEVRIHIWNITNWESTQSERNWWW